MPVGKFFYMVRNNADGSSEVDFFADKEAADLARAVEEKAGRNYTAPQSIELEFSATGALLSPDATADELRQKLAETQAVARQFTQNAAPAAVKAQAAPVAPAVEASPLDAIQSLEGKEVVFAGKLVTMSRPRAKDYAKSLGASVAGFVTETTDILVVGEDGGSKLERAEEEGNAIVVTEKEWNRLARRIAANTKPASSPSP